MITRVRKVVLLSGIIDRNGVGEGGAEANPRNCDDHQLGFGMAPARGSLSKVGAGARRSKLLVGEE